MSLNQINLAAGFVYCAKDQKASNIYLVSDPLDPIRLSATPYPQGRGTQPLYGSPYLVTVGFPLNCSKLTTQGKIKQQKLFLEKIVHSHEIEYDDAFGSSDYLTVMFNGGIKASKLAYSIAHLKLMKLQNPNSKVTSYKINFTAFYTHLILFVFKIVLFSE